MPHLTAQLVYELAERFCSDWLAFSAFCSEMLLCLSFYSWLSCSAVGSHVFFYLSGCTARLRLLRPLQNGSVFNAILSGKLPF